MGVFCFLLPSSTFPKVTQNNNMPYGKWNQLKYQTVSSIMYILQYDIPEFVTDEYCITSKTPTVWSCFFHYRHPCRYSEPFNFFEQKCSSCHFLGINSLQRKWQNVLMCGNLINLQKVQYFSINKIFAKSWSVPYVIAVMQQ